MISGINFFLTFTTNLFNIIVNKQEILEDLLPGKFAKFKVPV